VVQYSGGAHTGARNAPRVERAAAADRRRPPAPAGAGQQPLGSEAADVDQQETFTDYLVRTERERDARLESLWRMTPAERSAAMRRGDLSMEQCCAWAARNPSQVPLINGEWEFIVAYMPEVCE
jgi:hypothetical protein